MLLPLADRDDQKGFPLVNLAIIVLSAVVFAFQVGNDALTLGYSVIPLEITTGRDLVGPAQVVRPDNTIAIIPEAPGPTPIWLTLVTAMFLHGGFVHLVGNMWFLFVFGDNVERAFGHRKYAVFYLICGVAASIAHVLSDTGSPVPSLGASGAISGVMAAYFVMFAGNPIRIPNPLKLYQGRSYQTFLPSLEDADLPDPTKRWTLDVPALAFIGLWAWLQFAQGWLSIRETAQTGGVAYFAHIGGFLVGMGLGLAWRPRGVQSLFSPSDWRKAVAEIDDPAERSDEGLDAAWFAAQLSAEPTIDEYTDLHLDVVVERGPAPIRAAWMRLPEDVWRQLDGLRVRDVIDTYGARSE